MIYIISSRISHEKASALGLEKKAAWFEIIPQAPKGGTINGDDQVYLDISGIAQEDLKSAIGKLKKSRTGSFWGIIDPKGAATDPALFFFEGASDYIGPGLVKSGLSKKRFNLALPRTQERKTAGAAVEADDETAGKRKNHKFQAGKFEGWKTIRAGTSLPFFFLYVSLSGKSRSVSPARENAFIAMKNRLREILQSSLREADALLWMDTDDDSLFLIPPKAANCRAAVEASLKMILNSRLIGLEKLDLPAPVNFTFALHYGKTSFAAPGKTGAVISEAVNYIFHLGAKKAEAGRLTVSAEVPEDAVPEGLFDLFSPAGIFEGIPIRHSKRFVY